MGKMTVTKYIVEKPFQYGDESFEPGDEWVPACGRWDNLIKSQRKVRKVEEPVDATDLSEKKNKELRTMLEELDLPVYGNKAVLVQRLQEAMDG